MTGREELSSNVKEEKKQRLRATPFDQMHLRKKKSKKRRDGSQCLRFRGVQRKKWVRLRS